MNFKDTKGYVRDVKKLDGLRFNTVSGNDEYVRFTQQREGGYGSSLC